MADLEGTDERSASVAKDLFSGAMGGIAQVLLGMCFLLVFVIFGFVLTSHSRFFKLSDVSRASKNNGSFNRYRVY